MNTTSSLDLVFMVALSVELERLLSPSIEGNNLKTECNLSHCQGIDDFVVKVSAVNALPALAGAGGVARLDHKAFDAAVELASIVVAARTQCKEVLG